jgi:phosphoribosylformylglycinamidine synthase
VRVTVLIRPKDGILDPQGDAVESSLRKLGFDVEHVRVGRVVDFEVDTATDADTRAAVKQMCEQLLANPLIETYSIGVHAK